MSPPFIATSAPSKSGKAHACPETTSAMVAIVFIGSSNMASIVPSTIFTIGSIISSTTQSPTSSILSPIHLIGFLIIFFIGFQTGGILKSFA